MTRTTRRRLYRPECNGAALHDSSYMIMNSDIYSTGLTGHKMIVVVCDNVRYAVISRLQQFKGTPGFNSLLKDYKTAIPPFSLDFVKRAESMGAYARKVASLAQLEQAMDWAKGNDRTTAISIVSDAFVWTPATRCGMWACRRSRTVQRCRSR